MDPFTMVVFVVLITAIASLIGRLLHRRRGKNGNDDHGWKDWDWSDMGMGAYGRDNKAHERIAALEERARVLERIVTDPANKLSREIDDLNDPK